MTAITAERLAALLREVDTQIDMTSGIPWAEQLAFLLLPRLDTLPAAPSSGIGVNTVRMVQEWSEEHYETQKAQARGVLSAAPEEPEPIMNEYTLRRVLRACEREVELLKTRFPASPSAAEIEFFRRCWDRARDGRDIDGSDVQEWGEELGFLVKVVATAPCGDGCYCYEYYGEFPADCYRLVDAAHCEEEK